MKDQFIPLVKHYVALIKIDSFDNSVDFIEEISRDIISNLGLKVVKKFSHLDLVICSDRSKKEFKKSLEYALFRYDVQSIRVRVVNFD